MLSGKVYTVLLNGKKVICETDKEELTKLTISDLEDSFDIADIPFKGWNALLVFYPKNTSKMTPSRNPVLVYFLNINVKFDANKSGYTKIVNLVRKNIFTKDRSKLYSSTIRGQVFGERRRDSDIKYICDYSGTVLWIDDHERSFERYLIDVDSRYISKMKARQIAELRKILCSHYPSIWDTVSRHRY